MWCIWMNADEAETGFLGAWAIRAIVLSSCSNQTPSQRQQFEIAAIVITSSCVQSALEKQQSDTERKTSHCSRS
ncbi:hypothetical protein [Microcoleus vaginatus]|uniref:hypothetical protein n=1 Tax=Microcoleus vaginatus TaxID=119532 RepID=UPI001F6191D0